MKARPCEYVIIFLMTACLAGTSAGADPAVLFGQANALYQEGQYEEALQGYEQILAGGVESGVLYYNMGNCYYKLGELGPSILFYERARRLMPRDEDLLANLAIANLSVMDKIEPRPDFLLLRLWRGFVHLLPPAVLMAAGLGVYLAAVLVLILWIILRRRFLGRTALVLGAAVAVLAVMLVSRWHDDARNREAVILADKVDVMSAPTARGGTEIFSLHEGTKVTLDQQQDEWVEIILPDRKVGWVKADVLGVI